jgi:hypothetical protein
MLTDPTDAYKSIVSACRRGRDIDENRVLRSFLACYPHSGSGERTFEEQTVITPTQEAALRAMTESEREVLRECLEFMMREVEDNIRRNMS